MMVIWIMLFCRIIIWLKNQVYALSKLNSKELYKIQFLLKYTRPTSQHYFENNVLLANTDWKKIRILPRVLTVGNRIRVFQYKPLNKISFLKKILFKFGIVSRSFCSFCNSKKEAPFHIFSWLHSHAKSLESILDIHKRESCHFMFNTT